MSSSFGTHHLSGSFLKKKIIMKMSSFWVRRLGMFPASTNDHSLNSMGAENEICHSDYMRNIGLLMHKSY